VKLAITADVHLKTEKEVPERYNALRGILRQCAAEGITTLVICGDLFDYDFSNFADFENLCAAHSDVMFWILPGNHDARLSIRALTGRNIRIFEKAEIVEAGRQLLFLPYEHGSLMGVKLADFSGELNPGEWVLMAHGDYLQGTRVQHESEPDRYMPLSRDDLQRYHPSRVFLGHIHAASDGEVIYPGSPCGLDISETGSRRFLIYDTATGTVSPRALETDVVFGELQLTVLPVEDDAAQAAAEVKDWLSASGLFEHKKTARLRVRAFGYSRDRGALKQAIEQELAGFHMYKDEPVDISGVSITADAQRSDIAEKVRAEIHNLELANGQDEPGESSILLQALKVIFEG